MTVIRTELDALLERVREDKADTTGKNRNQIAYDCWRMFEDLAACYKEEREMRDRYKAQSKAWMERALEICNSTNALSGGQRNAVILRATQMASPEHCNITPQDQFVIAQLVREAACPICLGRAEDCQECKGTGLVSVAYDTLRVHYKLLKESGDYREEWQGQPEL